jgi:hypothetical protein
MGWLFVAAMNYVTILTNGIFLACTDFLSKFDPFLNGHIRNCGNPGTENVYLSSTSYEEFISLLRTKVMDQMSEIKETKHYVTNID